MIAIYRDPCEALPVYDVLVPDVEEAWVTGDDRALHKVTTYRTFVAQAFDGEPPSDEEVLRLSGLAPTEEGRVIVSYVPRREASVFRAGPFAVPIEATSPRWGLLVARLKPSTEARSS